MSAMELETIVSMQKSDLILHILAQNKILEELSSDESIFSASEIQSLTKEFLLRIIADQRRTWTRLVSPSSGGGFLQEHPLTQMASVVETSKIVSSTIRKQDWLEKSVPRLSNTTVVGWRAFTSSYTRYIQEGGSRHMSSFMDGAAMSGYSRRLRKSESELMSMDSMDLVQKISDYHFGIVENPILDSFSSLAMIPRTKFGADATTIFLDQFWNVYDRTPGAEKFLFSELVRLFVNKYEPAASRPKLLLHLGGYTNVCNDPAALMTKMESWVRYETHVAILDTEQTVTSKLGQAGKTAGGGAELRFLSRRFDTREGARALMVLAAAAASESKASSIACFNCGSNHHFKDCPDKAKCGPCKTSKHAFNSSDCPARRGGPSGSKPRANAVSALEKLSNILAENDNEEVQPRDEFFLDTGATSTFVNNGKFLDDISLSPPPSLHSCRTVDVANGVGAPIIGQGSVLNTPAELVPSFSNSLLSISQYTDNGPGKRPNVVIFDSTGAIGFRTNALGQTILNFLKLTAEKQNLVSLRAVQRGGLYRTSLRELRANNFASAHVHPAISLGHPNRASASYYTVQNNTLADLVRFWHECWFHLGMEEMIRIVQNNSMTNIPKELTPDVIRRYFPMCSACTEGNLAKKPHAKESSSVELSVGEVWEIDLKPWTGVSTASQSKPIGGRQPTMHVKSFSGCKYSCLAIDVKSKKRFGWGLRLRKNLLRCVRQLWSECQRQRREMKIIRVDKEFDTADIHEFCNLHHISIQYASTAEHEDIGNVERSHRTLQEAVVKVLASKPHLTSHYWALAFANAIFVGDAVPPDAPPHISPHEMWEGKKLDLNSTPLIPFGSIVMAHIPLALQQGTLGPRCFETVAVGAAPGHKGNIKLYNPLTKRTFFRRSFRVMGPVPIPSKIFRFATIDLDSVADGDGVQGDFLPEGEFALEDPIVGVATPKVLERVTLANLKKWGLKDLRTHCRSNGLSQTGCKEALIGKLRIFLELASRALAPILPASVVVDLGVEPASVGGNASLGEDMPVRTPLFLPSVDDVVPATVTHDGGRTRRAKRTNRRNRATLRSSNQNFSRDVIEHGKIVHAPTPLHSVGTVTPADAVRQSTRKRKLNLHPRTHLARSIDWSPLDSLKTSSDRQSSPYSCVYVADRGAKIHKPVWNEAQIEALINRTRQSFLAPRSSSSSSSTILRTDASINQVFSAIKDKGGSGILQSVTQARTSDAARWNPPIASELNSLGKERNVWIVPSIPIKDIPRHLIVPSKCVFDIQYNPDGTFKKDKVRLVCRGDRWEAIFDTETYAGTVRSESVKFVIAIAAELDLDLESIDVKTAFLHGDLEPGEIIYMRRPAGMTDADMPEVVQLVKCIYGLPQASQRFRKHSDGELRRAGFKPLISDPCVYLKSEGSDFIIAMIHVDDIGFATSSSAMLAEVKRSLSETYEISVIKDMEYYLGMHILRDRPNKAITILQDGYIMSLVERWGIDVSSGAYFPSTPMIVDASPTHLRVAKRSTSDVLLSPSLVTIFQAKVGGLVYLAKQTRPDILFPVSEMSRQCKMPTQRNMLAVDHILRYVAGTRMLGLYFHSGEGIRLYATVDASYACHADLKSHTGLTLHIGRMSGSVHSLSKKQTVTADSSTVAELIGAHSCSKEILWGRNFLEELNFPQQQPTILFEDNLSTIAIISKPGNGNKSKHIHLRYNVLRELVLNKMIEVVHLPGIDMTSDILTKATGTTVFLHLRPRLLGCASKIPLASVNKASCAQPGVSESSFDC